MQHMLREPRTVSFDGDMRLPLALDLKVGTDICDVRRMVKIISASARRRDMFIAKFLNKSEVSQLGQLHLRPLTIVKTHDEELYVLARRLAGRFAAKEAAKKAWGASIISWHDLYIEYAHDLYNIICTPGTPLSERKKASALGRVTEQVGQLSISHDGDYAVATVLAAPLHSDILIELRRRKAEAESIFYSSSRRVSLASNDESAKATTSAESD